MRLHLQNAWRFVGFWFFELIFWQFFFLWSNLNMIKCVMNAKENTFRWISLIYHKTDILPLLMKAALQIPIMVVCTELKRYWQFRHLILRQHVIYKLFFLIMLVLESVTLAKHDSHRTYIKYGHFIFVVHSYLFMNCFFWYLWSGILLGYNM